MLAQKVPKLRSYARHQYFTARCAVLISPILFAYFILGNDGVSPGLQIEAPALKLIIKIGSILALMLVTGMTFRRGRGRDFLCWTAIGFPIVCFAVLSLFSGEKFFLQAINAALFLPILAINWCGREARFRVLFGTASRIIVLQILIVLMFPKLLGSSWENGAITGALGNPNVFSLFCLMAFYWFSLVERKFIHTLLAGIGVFLSGSLTALIVFIIASAFAFSIWKSARIYFSAAAALAFYLLIFPEPAVRALSHALAKMISLKDYIFNQDEVISVSVSYRVRFFIEGVRRMRDDGFSWFWGHPNGLIMYTGDGYLTAIMVTHGIIILALFIFYFFILASRAGIGDQSLFHFSKTLLVCVFFYLIANRILDYYPAALLLMLSVGYIVSFYRTSVQGPVSSLHISNSQKKLPT